MLKRNNKPLKRTPLANGNTSIPKGDKPLRKSTGLARGPSKLKAKPISEEKTLRLLAMKGFFQKMWETRPHYSEVSGTWLSGYCFGKEFLSIFQHHILPKEIYSEAAFDPENIIFLTPDEHAQVEKSDTCFEEVNNRRIKLLEKYADSVD